MAVRGFLISVLGQALAAARAKPARTRRSGFAFSIEDEDTWDRPTFAMDLEVLSASWTVSLPGPPALWILM